MGVCLLSGGAMCWASHASGVRLKREEPGQEVPRVGRHTRRGGPRPGVL